MTTTTSSSGAAASASGSPSECQQCSYIGPPPPPPLRLCNEKGGESPLPSSLPLPPSTFLGFAHTAASLSFIGFFFLGSAGPFSSYWTRFPCLLSLSLCSPFSFFLSFLETAKAASSSSSYKESRKKKKKKKTTTTTRRNDARQAAAAPLLPQPHTHTHPPPLVPPSQAFPFSPLSSQDGQMLLLSTSPAFFSNALSLDVQQQHARGKPGMLLLLLLLWRWRGDNDALLYPSSTLFGCVQLNASLLLPSGDIKKNFSRALNVP